MIRDGCDHHSRFLFFRIFFHTLLIITLLTEHGFGVGLSLSHLHISLHCCRFTGRHGRHWTCLLVCGGSRGLTRDGGTGVPRGCIVTGRGNRHLLYCLSASKRPWCFWPWVGGWVGWMGRPVGVGLVRMGWACHCAPLHHCHSPLRDPVCIRQQGQGQRCVVGGGNGMAYIKSGVLGAVVVWCSGSGCFSFYPRFLRVCFGLSFLLFIFTFDSVPCSPHRG